jgi:hypothetical protein
MRKQMRKGNSMEVTTMSSRIIPALFSALILLASPYCMAQRVEPASSRELQSLPEEVVVTAEPSLMKLRLQVVEAEKDAYDIFNKFNDEDRFRISCNMHQPTGTRIERQICQPEFEREATRAHGQDYFENAREMLNYMANCRPGAECRPPSYTPPVMSRDVASAIASQQEDYRLKIKQVAEENPEFLEAIIHYSNLRENYEEATRTNKKIEP